MAWRVPALKGRAAIGREQLPPSGQRAAEVLPERLGEAAQLGTRERQGLPA